jgi:hypothetical protein
MIKLTEIIANGETKPISLEVNSFNFMESKSSNGSIVYYGTGCIEVTESVKEINQLQVFEIRRKK